MIAAEDAYKLIRISGNREAPRPLAVHRARGGWWWWWWWCWWTARCASHRDAPSHLGRLRVGGRDPVCRCQRPGRGRERPPGVDGSRGVRRVRRRVRRRVVPARGRGEGLDGPVVAEGGRPLLLLLRWLLLLAAPSAVHVASRRLVTSYMRERRLFEHVMMQVVLGGARDAARWQQSATGTGCRCVWHGNPAADDALDADAADAAADAGHTGHHAGTGDAHVTGRVVIAAKQTPPESLPGINRLAAPDPDARGDADRERHEILEHQDRVERPGTWSTGTGQRAEPLVPQRRLVDVTTQHHAGREGVEDAEHADPYHELLELVSLGTGLPLDDRADTEEAHEASEEEARAEQEIDEERRQDKVAHTLGGDGAHTGHRIASYTSRDVRPDCLYRRRQPCHQVEVLRVRGYRLVAPLEARREEPSERQDHPPHRRRHAEEVDHEEDGHARARALRARLERRTVAGDLLVAEHAARQVAHGHDEVAGR